MKLNAVLIKNSSTNCMFVESDQKFSFLSVSTRYILYIYIYMQPLPKGKIYNHLPTETFYTEQT